MDFLNEERSNYYKAKKLDIERERKARQVIRQDALFIKHYGMSAYIELFPEAKDMGISWHESVLEELEALRSQELAQLLSGIYNASAATKDKSANRRFRRIITALTKRW